MPVVFSLLSASDNVQLYSKHQDGASFTLQKPVPTQLSYIFVTTIFKRQPGTDLTMPNTFHSEGALNEQLNTCKLFLGRLIRAYNELDSELTHAEDQTPNDHDIDMIRLHASMYKLHSVSQSSTRLCRRRSSLKFPQNRQQSLDDELGQLQYLLDDNEATIRKRVRAVAQRV